jgi:hypothetical protein
VFRAGVSADAIGQGWCISANAQITKVAVGYTIISADQLITRGVVFTNP